MKLVLDIKNENKARKLIEFLKDIPYVEIEKGMEQRPANKIQKLPAEFKKPLTVKKYIHIPREEIYEDRLINSDTIPH